MLALRFHNWELLDLSMFMSVVPLLSGSILGSKGPNRSSLNTMLSFNYSQGFSGCNVSAANDFTNHMLVFVLDSYIDPFVNILWWRCCHCWPFWQIICGLNNGRMMEMKQLDSILWICLIKFLFTHQNIWRQNQFRWLICVTFVLIWCCFMILSIIWSKLLLSLLAFLTNNMWIKQW